MNDLTDAEKEIFRAATERRRQNGVRLRKVTFMAEASQVDSFNLLLDSFIRRWGKEQAIETLLWVMSKVEARMQEKERNGEAKPQRFKKVSAPRVGGLEL